MAWGSPFCFLDLGLGGLEGDLFLVDGGMSRGEGGFKGGLSFEDGSELSGRNSRIGAWGTKISSSKFKEARTVKGFEEELQERFIREGEIDEKGESGFWGLRERLR